MSVFSSEEYPLLEELFWRKNTKERAVSSSWVSKTTNGIHHYLLYWTFSFLSVLHLWKPGWPVAPRRKEHLIISILTTVTISRHKRLACLTPVYKDFPVCFQIEAQFQMQQRTNARYFFSRLPIRPYSSNYTLGNLMNRKW